MRKFKFYKKTAILCSLGSVIGIIIAIILAVLEMGVWCLVLKQIIASGVGVILAFYCTNTVFKCNFNKDTALKLIKYSVSMMFQRMSEIINAKVPSILLGSLSSVNALGLYDRCLYLAQLQNTMLNPFFWKSCFCYIFQGEK